ncbi:META domain-containing protein [Methylophaga sp. OBS3]|uniref:META domain-containing protein n=1 Tax=Methylophaga sp. OBS3 TaxID=2991934 RepID=UPI0022561622|nr:META domain-containing protein [Methylophaga sp. OBS3]MCX4190186.1 META domain-containing protein [Methylophaga sp. OBS3]
MTFWLKLTALVFVGWMLTSCQSDDGDDDILDWRASVSFPASYSGTLPCADCPGIDYRLNLFADHSFFLQTEYQERSVTPSFTLGHWQLHNQNTLVLLSDVQNYRFAINDQRHLTLLNQQGQLINSELNYQLNQDKTYRAIYPALPMRGLYREDAEGGYFNECLTGQSWAIADIADYEALKTRYNELNQDNDTALLVTLNGALLASSGKLKVSSFTGIWPGETCGQPGYSESLLDTYWKLTRLHNQPVIITDGQREPSLIMASGDDPKVTGYDGCNRLMGSFYLKANTLKFRKMASTMMACENSMETAQRFHEALEVVHMWHIKGQNLELSDKDGNTLARFQAVHL